MAFSNNITFTLGQGGLNTPLPGTDYISGIVFKAATVPSGFTWSTPLEVFSIQNAQTLGIFGDFSDETPATSKITVSATGSAGNTVTLSVVEPSINGTFNTVPIGTYTLQSADINASTLANNLSAFINTQYANTGYSSTTPTGGSFSLTARTGLGTIINGTSPTVVISGTETISAAAFSGGVNSVRKEENYQISEFFRQAPNAVLWVQYEQSFGSFNCINTIQNQAGNVIKQLGLYDSSGTSSSNITADIDAINIVCKTLFNNYAPLVVTYAPNIYSTTDLSTLPNLRLRNNQYVSCLITQDGGNVGAFLSKMYGKSVPAYGSISGAIAFAKTSEDIGWVQKFNLSNGSELAIPAFSNTALYQNLFASNFNLLSQLDAYGYIFCMTRPNLIGTWVNDSHSCVAITSDYAYIERNRVINKASRIAYASLAPQIEGPLVVDPKTGQLTVVQIAQLKSLLSPSFNAMVANAEISGYSVYINPSQNVLSTSIVYVQITIVPIGVARQISVTLGFATSI